jgi:hypothetical protein
MHMSTQRTFNFPEAKALLPKLKTMLKIANQELAAKAEILANAYVYYEKCEQEMNKVKPALSSRPDMGTERDDGFADLRQCRLNFQAAIESLSQAKQEYVQTINFWFDEITDTGVILRDIKSGLLDFPARSDDFDYYLCWQLGENEIGYWHMITDGFPGRRPLAILNEYM